MGAALDVRAHEARGLVGVAREDRVEDLEMLGHGDADAIVAGEVMDSQNADSVADVAEDAGGDIVSRCPRHVLVEGLVPMHERRAL